MERLLRRFVMFRTVTFLWFGLSMALAQEPPVFTAGSIRNAANLDPGITAGAIVTITGLRLANSTSPRLISRFDHRLNPAVAEAAQPHWPQQRSASVLP